MNRYRKIASFIIIFEIVLIIIANIIMISNIDNQTNEIARDIVDGNTVYTVTHTSASENYIVVMTDVILAIFFVVTVCVIVYVGQKIIKPFSMMTGYANELAKGNLVVPVDEDKNKFFGKFRWSLDMLRQKLEDNKTNELELNKKNKTLILSISHDIRTPLSAIRLYIKALGTDMYEDEDSKKRAIAGIESNALEIERYVDQIVSASKDNFLNLTVSVNEIYLDEVISSIRDLYKDKFKSLHTEFLIENFNNYLVKADADRLIEVIQNILENAIKYGDGRRVEISFDTEEDVVLINIANLGNSLKEEEKNNIFDSFYRGSNTENINGSGLGLYICKQLMRMMDGDVFVNSFNKKSNLKDMKIDDDNWFVITVVVRKI